MDEIDDHTEIGIIDAEIDDISTKFNRLNMLADASRDAWHYFGDYHLPALREMAERVTDIRVYECLTREASFFIGERHFEFQYNHLTHQVEFLEYLRSHPNGPWMGNFREKTEMPKLVDLLSADNALNRVLAVFLLEALAHGHSDGAIPELRVGTDMRHADIPETD